MPVDLGKIERGRHHMGGGFSGRWWGRCPCGRRVGKLYLPAGATRFACRHCHGLTYTSCQEHDKRVDALRRNPEVLAELVNNPRGCSVSNLGLALKALRYGQERR